MKRVRALRARFGDKQMVIGLNLGAVGVWRGLQFLTVLMASRIQSLTQTGTSGVVLSVSLVATLVLDVGVSAHVSRVPPSAVPAQRDLVRSIAWLKIAFLILGLSIFLSPLVPQISDRQIIALSFTLVYLCSVFEPSYLYQVHGRVHVVNAVGAISAVAPCFIVLTRSDALPTTGELTLVYGAQLCGTLALAFHFARSHGWRACPWPNFAALMAHVRAHRALMMKSLLAPLLGYVDAIVVASLIGLEAAGVFRIASIFAGFANLLAGSIHPYFIHYLNSHPPEDRELAYRRLLVRSVAAVAGIVGITLPLSAGGAWIFHPERWVAILVVASGLIVAKALVLPGAALDTWLLVHHQDRESMLYGGSIGAIALGLYLTFLPWASLSLIGYLQGVAAILAFGVFSRFRRTAGIAPPSDAVASRVAPA